MSVLAVPALAQTGSESGDEAEETAAGTEATGMTALAETDLDAVDDYRLALLRIKGHLGVARALLQVDEPGTEYHMGESVQTIFGNAEDALAERSAPLTRDILSELENAAGLEANRALRASESAENAVNGSFAQTGAMDRESVLGLVEALLRGAVANYAEAVSNNEVADLRKYQTGRGLVIQAEALVRHSTALRGHPGQEELLKVVTLIRQAWPGIMPPPIVFDPARVAGRLDEAVAVMEEIR